MKRILVVEDEARILNFIRRGLVYKGFEVVTATNGEEALNQAHSSPPDLVVLDVMLPGLDGFEVCRRLRAGGDLDLPILMLTARDSLPDKIKGLDSGADDYITKPFDFDELLARIRAGIRRSAVNASPQHNQKLQLGDLQIDRTARRVQRAGQPLDLTAREFDLLDLMARHAGQVLTKEVIFENIWGYDNEAGLEIIKVYINYLRSKLNFAPGLPDLIHSIRGVGYLLKT